VLLSSHLTADLERVCDFLVVLSASRTQVVGDIDQLLASHRLLSGPRRDVEAGIAGVASIVQEGHTERQSSLLVRTSGPILDPTWTVESLGLEDLVLAYLGQPQATALPGPRLAQTAAEA